MRNLTKIFSPAGILVPLASCFMLLGVLTAVPKVSALTINDLSGQPQVLDASASNSFPYPTGSLVNDHGTIYFISGTTKVPFTSYKAFTGLGYSLRNVVKGDLSAYSQSQSYVISTANAAHPWGSWLSYKSVVYYSSQQGMIGVPSAAVFLANGGQWNLVVKANKYDVAVLNSAPALPVLTSGDSRVMGQTTLQFGGSSAPASNPVPSNTTANPQASSPAVTPTATSTVPTSTVSVLLPTTIYATSTYTYYVTSADPNTPLFYNFFWDDGTPANSLAVSAATHTYYLPGTYMLQITVTDGQNNTSATTVPVTVVLPPNKTPSVPQITLPTGVIIGAQATVTASASDPQNLPIVYDFSWGDGSADTIAPSNSATHVYSSSNSFVVKVTVTNTLGFSSSASSYLYVAP